MMQRDADSGSGVITFLCGAMVGAGVALLFAPMTGQETRRRLAEIDPNALTNRVNDAVNSVSTIVERGVDAYKKASTEAQA